jgi:hypothetical protein
MSSRSWLLMELFTSYKYIDGLFLQINSGKVDNTTSVAMKEQDIFTMSFLQRRYLLNLQTDKFFSKALTAFSRKMD